MRTRPKIKSCVGELERDSVRVLDLKRGLPVMCVCGINVCE